MLHYSTYKPLVILNFKWIFAIIVMLILLLSVPGIRGYELDYYHIFGQACGSYKPFVKMEFNWIIASSTRLMLLLPRTQGCDLCCSEATMLLLLLMLPGIPKYDMDFSGHRAPTKTQKIASAVSQQSSTQPCHILRTTIKYHQGQQSDENPGDSDQVAAILEKKL
jgi:hypothetical protein